MIVVGAKRNNETSIYNQLMDSLSKIDELLEMHKEDSKNIKSLNDTIQEMITKIEKKDELIDKLLLEIERLKTKKQEKLL